MEQSKSAQAFWRSWIATEGIESFGSLHSWIVERNANIPVAITRIPLEECSPWHYDESLGRITNPTGSFFQISGLRALSKNLQTGEERVIAEQPILLQDEIGYLGIIAKEFDGVVHFLMQAKIEPGNVNRVQISPTIQATRSNFLQLHGGRKPAYLDYFLHSEQHTIIVDQIQSEQSSRFLGKRNRNVMILLDADEPIELTPNHKWMTLGQLKHLMDYDNLVNMDTRTVLSCIPWSFWGEPDAATVEGCDETMVRSITAPLNVDAVNDAYHRLNNYKMFDTTRAELVPLNSLADWEYRGGEYVHRVSYPYKVIFCDIAIEGREVVRWNQPLFEAVGKAFFGLLSCVMDGRRRFLVHLTPELGCFDKVELGPTMQREAGSLRDRDAVEKAFEGLLAAGKGIQRDVLLSEEGGRFFCEQNRNVLIALDTCPGALVPEKLPDGYLWLDYATLNLLLRVNNVLNIQLRNLLSLINI